MKEQEIIAKWNELKDIMESIELDVHKNASGNKSAGVRARRGLRSLKNDVTNLVKLTLQAEKEKK